MRFLIIEDEIAASSRLRRMINSLKPEAECVAEVRGVADSLHWLNDHGQADVDVAFVDIQLSDGISFELFELVKFTIPVIFTTAYDEYVLRAFKVHTIDYLLKPIKLDQLRQALGKLDRVVGKPDLPAIQAAITAMPVPHSRRRFVVKGGRSIKIVNAVEISYFYSEHKITYLVCFDGRKFALDFTLDQLESSLDPHEFYRANRQYIVSIKGIAEMHAHSRSRLVLTLNPVAPHDVVVSTDKAPVFKEWLQGNIPQ